MINKIKQVMKISRLGKNKAKAILGDVPEDKIFWLCDGRALRNLKDLVAALNEIGGDVFNHHVNKERNDFKNWIKEVIGDSKLAQDISRSKKKSMVLKKINKRLSQLNNVK